ncbi:hypothetical protein [Selenomonas sp.]|uniref:hypothetical protein n=1 Tax=Selenomonas sp. TaxID=2053611 RepID=UPI0025FC2901|nr:hypothetical protein [Selenomonas sp.]
MLHDYLHCLVFKEQSVSLSALSLQATHLSYRIQLSLSRTFLKSFSKLFGTHQRPANQGLLCCFVAVSVSDLYYITRVAGYCQHYLKKKLKKQQGIEAKGGGQGKLVMFFRSF